MSRVIGPCRWPLVRATIRRGCWGIAETPMVGVGTGVFLSLLVGGVIAVSLLRVGAVGGEVDFLVNFRHSKKKRKYLK
jgi:hypothetical protein